MKVFANSFGRVSKLEARLLALDGSLQNVDMELTAVHVLEEVDEVDDRVAVFVAISETVSSILRLAASKLD